MNKLTQQQWIYTQRPQGRVEQSHYRLEQQPLTTQLANNEVLLESKYISVDPYMRIQQSASDSWESPHPLNVVQGAAAVSTVIASSNPNLHVGDWVVGYTGWQTHSKVHGSKVSKLDQNTADVTTALGVLGMPGRTAWFGLMEVGQPKAGDTLVVSGAAGAVGSLVCQFGIKAGCRVIGIAGSDEKCAWLRSLGVSETINYNHINGASLSQKLHELGGVDVYFDNVGGCISDAVLENLKLRARVVICGQISQYNGQLDTPELGPRFLHHILYQRATIQGILARDFSHRMSEMIERVSPWLNDGSLVFQSTIAQGFDQLPNALTSLFDGANKGKLIVKV